MKGQLHTAAQVKAPLQGLSLQRILAQLLRWYELHRERQALASMSDELLKDIGLSRADILEESERAFWDDPLRK